MLFTLFCTLLCRQFTTTTWKCLILHFLENLKTRQRLRFSFPDLRYSLLEFRSGKICQHLTNWTRWDKHRKVWSNANSLFLKVTFSQPLPPLLRKLPIGSFRLRLQLVRCYVKLHHGAVWERLSLLSLAFARMHKKLGRNQLLRIKPCA